jgi:aspartate carbamoyltransferase catalytic subunit
MNNINWGSEEVAEYQMAEFEKFVSLPAEQIEQACRNDQGKLIHILRAEHFDLEFLEIICQTTNAARRIAKLEDNFLKGLLRSKSILNYFAQPSSRTFLSFSTAEAHLGMRREEIRDLQTSSASKGESDRDSLRTISSYFDAMVCRTPSDIYDLFSLWVMKTSKRELPIINAGSGKKEHPTQGVLDYYTIRESFSGKTEGKVVAYVGDCLRGRTVHSLAKIMSLHKNSTAYFVGPEELQIDEGTRTYIEDRGTKVHCVTESLQDVISVADVVYMTRIQNEHGGEGKYDPRFKFEAEMIDAMRDNAILMHPLPKREEIDPGIDDIDSKKVMYWRQMRNGMWTRVALLAYVFGVDDQIRNHYQKIQRSTAPKPL